MGIEIEKKYRLTSDQAAWVEDELASVAADYIGEEFEENSIYGGGVLDEMRAILRIRRTETRNILTLKRRIEDAFDAKQQIEYESEVSDPESIAEILTELKFVPRIVYEKRRKTWRFRQVEIVLDELPFGLYMEIEGAVTDIKEAEIMLGIEDFEVEPETYPRLARRMGVDTGSVVEARFVKARDQ